MLLRHAWQLVRETFGLWAEDKVPRLGAALAYYSVFSIAPLLVIVIAVAGFVFGEQAAQGRVQREVRNTLGAPTAEALQAMIVQARETGRGALATLIGVGVLLFGASGVFGQLQDALNTIWKVTPKPGRGLVGIVRDRFLSFAMVLGIGFLLLVSLAVTAALAALGDWAEQLPGGAYLWQTVNSVVSFGLIALLFATIFRVLPDVKVRWSDVWVGAGVTAFLFVVGKYLIGLYLGRSSFASVYGAAGSLVVILLWVYYSSQILLWGAEFTRAYTERFGVHAEPADNAVFVTAQGARQGMAVDAEARSVAETG